MIDILTRPNIAEMVLAFSAILFLREVAVFREFIPGKYVLTPLVTAAVLFIAVYSLLGTDLETYRVIITCGLILALVADTLLMIVEENLLPYGMIFFMGVHSLYVAAFTQGYSFQPWHLAPTVVLFAMLTGSGVFINRKAGKLAVPAMVYSAVIALMVFFALTGDYGSIQRKNFAVTGAVLFLISDTVLAVNAFHRPVPKSSVWTWALYGPSQLLIALSCFA